MNGSTIKYSKCLFHSIPVRLWETPKILNKCRNKSHKKILKFTILKTFVLKTILKYNKLYIKKKEYFGLLLLTKHFAFWVVGLSSQLNGRKFGKTLKFHYSYSKIRKMWFFSKLVCFWIETILVIRKSLNNLTPNAFASQPIGIKTKNKDEKWRKEKVPWRIRSGWAGQFRS